jgi:hypothetical protein
VLEQQNQFERAAAIAVFHLDIRRAVLALKRAIAADSANEPFRLVAMALAGYEGAHQMMMAGSGTTGGGGVGSLWKETCASLKEQIGSAYLRAAFAFLCADSVPDFAEVLDQYDEMSLADRIAFGCRFLPGADVSARACRVVSCLARRVSLTCVSLACVVSCRAAATLHHAVGGGGGEERVAGGPHAHGPQPAGRRPPRELPQPHWRRPDGSLASPPPPAHTKDA